MRIFLDANILFSAAKSDGAARKLIGLLLAARHECWVDSFVVTEARRNLLIKGPEALAALEELLTTLHLSDTQPVRSATKDVSWLPEKDQPVLAAAVRLRCDILVTGDKTHFGAGYGESFGGVTTHSARAVAARILDRPTT